MGRRFAGGPAMRRTRIRWGTGALRSLR
jgi:hypothetical protein